MGPTATIRCASCGAPIGTSGHVYLDAQVALGSDDRGEPRTWTSPVIVGKRVDLAAGFVNRKGRHPTGLRWYGKPVGRVTTASLSVRPPCVVTCGCGAETTIAGVDPEAREWATATAEERAARLLHDRRAIDALRDRDG